MLSMMKPARLGAIALALCAASTIANAQAAAPVPAHAADRCEAAVAETVRRIRGAGAQEIQFVGDKRVVLPAKGDDIDVKGEGRYGSKSASATGFAYSCVFNSRSGATSGVLFRETVGAARGSATTTSAALQPDLAQFSPENCESAAAAVLKAKYPRVGRIVFDGEGRELRAVPNALATLEGQGAVERAAGMNQVPFRYRCEFEARSGKVLKATTTE